MTWVGAIAAIAVGVYLLALALEHADEGLLQPDVASFHLPNVARWIQAQTFWQIDDFIPNRAPGNYPQTGDVYMLGLVLPWRSDFLVRFAAVPFLGLLALSVYAAARELGAAIGAALLAGAALVAIPAVGYLGLQGVADPEMLGLFAAGALFLLRSVRTGSPFDLVLAGLGLGLAFGTRWYAVPAVAAVVAVWLGARLVGRARAGLVRDAAIVCGLVALAGGFWLVRNLVESGNPVFPVAVSPLGLTIFDAPADLYREIEGFTLLHYATDPGVWREYLWSPFLEFLSWVAVLGWVGLAAAALRAWLRPPPSAPVGRILASAVAAALIVVAYLATPYTAVGPEGAPADAWVNARYVVPALVVGAPAIAWLIGSLGAGAVPVASLGLFATLDALRRSGEFPGGEVGAGALAAALAIAAVAAGLTLAVRRSAWRRWPAGALAAAGVAAVAGAFAAAAVIEDGWEESRYRGTGEPIAEVEAAVEPVRVGLLGEGWGILPLFGDRLGNEVEYLGRRREEMLRPLDTKAELARAIEAGGYDFVYVQDLDSLDEELPLRQAGWLEDLGFTPAARGYNPSFGPSVATELYVPAAG